MADILTEETDYFVREAKAAGSLDEFEKKLPAVTAATPATAKLSKAFAARLSKFLPEYAAYYLKQTDKSLKLDRVSKRTTAWIENWSGELAGLMRTTSKDQLEAMLKKEISNGGNISQFCVDLINSSMEKRAKENTGHPTTAPAGWRSLKFWGRTASPSRKPLCSPRLLKAKAGCTPETTATNPGKIISTWTARSSPKTSLLS